MARAAMRHAGLVRRLAARVMARAPCERARLVSPSCSPRRAPTRPLETAPPPTPAAVPTRRASQSLRRHRARRRFASHARDHSRADAGPTRERVRRAPRRSRGVEPDRGSQPRAGGAGGHRSKRRCRRAPQEPLRRAPAENEEGDPLLEWARDTWERLPAPGLGITNEGVRNGVTVAFLFFAAGMTVVAAVVVLALLRSLFRVATGRRPEVAAEVVPVREPLLVYVGGAPSSVERTVVRAVRDPRVRVATESPWEAVAQLRTTPPPPLAPPTATMTLEDRVAGAPPARRAPSFDILRSPASKVAVAVGGVRHADFEAARAAAAQRGRASPRGIAAALVEARDGDTPHRAVG